MNENPWRIDDLARLQRGRLQEEMRQIRLEQRALRAQAKGPGVFGRVWAALRAWFKPVPPQPIRPIHPRRPMKLAHARHHSRL